MSMFDCEPVPVWFESFTFTPHRQRRARKPSIKRMVANAEKTGKTVTSITLPDGTVLHFGEPKPTEASNPWLADLDKVTKQ
jgi:hypothetical protein